MDRLTKYNSFGVPEISEWNMRLAINKLALYENLIQEGRLIILPCKLGTDLYYPLFDCDLPDDEECTNDIEFDCAKCDHYSPDVVETTYKQSLIEPDGNLPTGYFLSYKEAEEKLKEIEREIRNDYTDTKR